MNGRRIIPLKAKEKVVKRHENGSKQVAFYYLHGKLVGHRSWDDGKLSIEYAIRNNVNHGAYTSYWPNGTVAWVTQYVDGKEHGISRQYDCAGRFP